ncbi:MAG: patatin-like phospholipase family protein [Planctomycetes bacterium]|nr:patatin-like phospholipase family protein [Planctomycetota bacterium]
MKKQKEGGRCNNKPFRVLTLDGGGMRGLYTAQLLLTLSQSFNPDFKSEDKNPDIGKSFDLICGTSTGAILACGLAAGIPIKKICQMYINKGQAIFPDPIPSKISVAWLAEYANKTTANSVMLEKALTECLGNMTLGTLYKNRDIKLCIPSVNASTYRAWVFKTGHNEFKNRADNYRLVDICLASAAAPIFFPILEQENPDKPEQIIKFVDGGLWANNPILVGLIEALTITDNDIPRQPIQLISVGTCDRPSGESIPLCETDWGFLDWEGGVKITKMAISAQAYGYTKMANFLAESIKKRGQEAISIRLASTDKAADRYESIGLDRAASESFSTLIDFATEDADNIMSEVLGGTHHGHDVIEDIFSNIEVL